MDGWQIQVLDANARLLGIVTQWSNLRVQLRGRKGGTWELTAPVLTGDLARAFVRYTYGQLGALFADYDDYAAAVATYGAEAGLGYWQDLTTGAEGFDPGVRIAVRRIGQATPVLTGYVTSVTSETTERGRTVTASGITDTGLLAHRLTLPTPWAEFTAQNVDAYWTESGPAEFIIHRLITRNAGLGALPDRQLIDSRVGTEVRVAPQKTAAGWTEVSTAGVTWAGNVATVNQNSTAAFRMTDAINLGTTDMATLVSHLDVSGECNFALYGHFNTTAAGAAPGQAGVVTEQYLGTKNTADRILWAAEAFRTRNAGKGWVRLQINVQAVGAQRTVEFLPEGGVFQKAMSGATARVSTRFENLAEVVEEIATQGDVYLTADAANGLPRVLVRSGDDKSSSVRLSTAIGNVTSHSTTLAAPKGNVVLVAGGGTGTARTLRSEEDATSLNEWGLRIEGFRDARDTTDTATLDARADEWITDNAATAGLKVEVTDVPGMSYGIDYTVGDKVQVLLDGVATTEAVKSVEINVDSSGTTVRPVVGSPELGEEAPGLYATVRDLRRRIAQLERRF